MSQGATFTIQPDLLVDRSALAGAMLGVAADLRLAACDARRAGVNPGEINAKVRMAHVRLSSLGCSEEIGVAVVHEHGAFVLHRSADGQATVHALGCALSPPDRSIGVEVFARSLYRQIVLRRLVTTLRTNGFAIVQRIESQNGSVTLRARLPLMHQSRPTARTAQPEFAVSVDECGIVDARLAGLHGVNRIYVNDLLARALRDAPEAAVRRRARPQVHAA